MSNELISALENRVTSAVDTIEGLRSEVKVLRDERQLLENKLRDLLQKIEGVDNGDAPSSGETSSVSESAPAEDSSSVSGNTGGFGFGRPNLGTGSTSSEY